MTRRMMMNKLIALFVLLLAAPVFADDDRFGSERFEVPRTSYTHSVDALVLIASAPAVQPGNTIGGEIYLKHVSCTGNGADDIHFYDTVTFQADTTIRARVIHQATLVTSVPYSILFSSGLMYDKSGGAPCVIQWDYTTPPRGKLNHY